MARRFGPLDLGSGLGHDLPSACLDTIVPAGVALAERLLGRQCETALSSSKLKVRVLHGPLMWTRKKKNPADCSGVIRFAASPRKRCQAEPSQIQRPSPGFLISPTAVCRNGSHLKSLPAKRRGSPRELAVLLGGVVLGDVLLDQLAADPDLVEGPVVVRHVGCVHDLWPVPVLNATVHAQDPYLELAVR